MTFAAAPGEPYMDANLRAPKTRAPPFALRPTLLLLLCLAVVDAAPHVMKVPPAKPSSAPSTAAPQAPTATNPCGVAAAPHDQPRRHPRHHGDAGVAHLATLRRQLRATLNYARDAERRECYADCWQWPESGNATAAATTRNGNRKTKSGVSSKAPMPLAKVNKEAKRKELQKWLGKLYQYQLRVYERVERYARAPIPWRSAGATEATRSAGLVRVTNKTLAIMCETELALNATGLGHRALHHAHREARSEELDERQQQQQRLDWTFQCGSELEYFDEWERQTEYWWSVVDRLAKLNKAAGSATPAAPGRRNVNRRKKTGAKGKKSSSKKATSKKSPTTRKGKRRAAAPKKG